MWTIITFILYLKTDIDIVKEKTLTSSQALIPLTFHEAILKFGFPPVGDVVDRLKSDPDKDSDTDTLAFSLGFEEPAVSPPSESPGLSSSNFLFFPFAVLG